MCVVYFDPAGPDDWHVQRPLTKLGRVGVRPVPVRHAGYPVSHFPAEASVLRELAVQVLRSGREVLPTLRHKRWGSQAHLGHLAERLSARGKSQPALSLIDKAMLSAPAHIQPGLLKQRSTPLQLLGRPLDTEWAIAAAVTLAPADAGPQALHGGMLAALGRLADASAACDRSVALDSDVATFHFQRCRALWRRRQWRSALAATKAALHLSPALRWLGRLWWSMRMLLRLRR